MPVYVVNAYYDPQNNEIVFPAGILQEPFTASMPPCRNYGESIIAHEITHALITMGKFDEMGNAKDWWTEDDYRNFRKGPNRFEFYDGLEIVAGIEAMVN